PEPQVRSDTRHRNILTASRGTRKACTDPVAPKVALDQRRQKEMFPRYDIVDDEADGEQGKHWHELYQRQDFRFRSLEWQRHFSPRHANQKLVTAEIAQKCRRSQRRTNPKGNPLDITRPTW